MPKLHLNLLAPEKKKKFLNLVRFIFVKELLEIFLLVVSIVTMANLIALVILNQTLTDLAESTILVNHERSRVEQEVAKANTITRLVVQSGKGYERLTPKLFETLTAVPNTITLQSVDIDARLGSISIIGVAIDRQALLDFRKSLGTISWIESTSAPLSQLLQKHNISFEIRGTVKTPGGPKKTSSRRSSSATVE